jgi:hypothetical protein
LEITNTDNELTKQVVDLFKWQATNNKIDLVLLTMLFHIISSGCSQVKTNIGKPIKLYFKVYQYEENKSDISESPSFSKDSFTINFSLKDPDVVTKDGKEKKIFRSFYKMITRQVIDMEVLA